MRAQTCENKTYSILYNDYPMDNRLHIMLFSKISFASIKAIFCRFLRLCMMLTICEK